MVMHSDDISILIPDGDSQHALPVTRCLARVSGFKVHILSRDPWSNVRFSRHCASFTHLNGASGDDQALDAISRTVKQVNAGVLLPVSEPGIRLAAARRRDLEAIVVTSVPPLDAFDTAIDKWRLADFMQTHGISTPRTILLRVDSALNEQLDELTFPVLLKPTRSTNGMGIRQFNDRSSLLNFLGTQQNNEREYIIQNLVRGYDIDCSVLCREGEILAYTIQKSIIPNPKRFCPPYAIEFLRHEEVLQVASKLLRALGWSGVAHLDMMVEEANNRVVIIELNARYWGSLLGSLSAGVNFPYLAVKESLGQPLPQVAFRHIRHIAPYASLRLLAHMPFAHGFGGFRFSETGWPYLLADPFSVAAGKAISLWKKLK